MPQTQLHAETNEAVARKLSILLGPLFEDEGLPISAFEDPDNPKLWKISVYCETTEAEAVRNKICSLAEQNGLVLDLKLDNLPDKDWVAETLRELSSVRAGRYIVHGSHESDIPKPHEIPVLIDAGLAFGTGHHGTTAGCLDMLNRVCKRKQFHNVLDLGTGSGVLAIAAAKTMPSTILATDIDPVATETASFNTKRNGVHQYIECITATGFNHRRFSEQGPFDLVIANILARPLQAMARELVYHTAPGGTVILSGLLPHQRAPLVASFRLQGLHLDHYHIRDGWLTLLFEKP